jgi:hypothetical protein
MGKLSQTKSREKLMLNLQTALLMKAEEYKPILTTTETDDNHLYYGIICHHYSNDVILRYGKHGHITSSQLYHLILEETDCLVTFEELNHVFTALDYKEDGKITFDEIFLWLQGSINSLPAITASGRIQNELLHVFSDRIWMSTFFFLLGSSLSALNNILKRFDNVEISLGSISVPFIVSSCFVLGTLGLTLQDVDNQCKLFRLQNKVKQVLLCWLQTEKYNQKDTNKNTFLNTNGLTRKNLRMLMDDANVSISDQLLLDCFGTYTVSKDNRMLESDIVNNISTQSNQFLTVCLRCFTNFTFLANFVWFLGAVGFWISSCVESNNIWFFIGDRVSQLITFQQYIGILIRI